ncbi:unnamed protein product [Cylicocyclus nassatus]|uniref:Uncharacterized protein n=1 Tax=Cylicocyclus nassatus TaxID=53992 RepID=A0AA36GHF5_CYLNA|nr:unnamed protein product [Cylicocyclus nassatus]
MLFYIFFLLSVCSILSDGDFGDSGRDQFGEHKDPIPHKVLLQEFRRHCYRTDKVLDLTEGGQNEVEKVRNYFVQTRIFKNKAPWEGPQTRIFKIDRWAPNKAAEAMYRRIYLDTNRTACQQKAAVDTILGALDDPDAPKLFFIDGPGASGRKVADSVDRNRGQPAPIGSHNGVVVQAKYLKQLRDIIPQKADEGRETAR